MIRIIGLGSPYGDDTAGWRVLDHLHSRLPDAIDLQRLDRPGAALINWFDDVSHLIVIDAISGHTTPGEILHLSPEHLDSESKPLSSHQLDLVQTLTLASTLGRLPAQVEIIGVAIGDPVERMAAVESGCRRLAQELQQRFATKITPATQDQPSEAAPGLLQSGSESG